jgi:mRNA interferase YafQ
MLEIRHTNRFIKELKLACKRGKDAKKLELVMEKLAKQEVLEANHRDHNLTGQFAHRRECHIESDWLLVYKVEKNTITFERTGTHSDLFK